MSEGAEEEEVKESKVFVYLLSTNIITSDYLSFDSLIPLFSSFTHPPLCNSRLRKGPELLQRSKSAKQTSQCSPPNAMKWIKRK